MGQRFGVTAATRLQQSLINRSGLLHRLVEELGIERRGGGNFQPRVARFGIHILDKPQRHLQILQQRRVPRQLLNLAIGQPQLSKLGIVGRRLKIAANDAQQFQGRGFFGKADIDVVFQER